MSHLLLHEPSRGIGGEADKRETFARRATVPSGGNAVNITEGVRKYAAEPSGARQIIRRMSRRASRTASQQTISKEEALQRGMEERNKEFVEEELRFMCRQDDLMSNYCPFCSLC